MALDPGNALLNQGLAGAIQTEMEAAFGSFDSDEAERNTAKFNDALAKAIINYFTANAEVSTDVDGVTVGVGTATGSGTIS